MYLLLQLFVFTFFLLDGDTKGSLVSLQAKNFNGVGYLIERYQERRYQASTIAAGRLTFTNAESLRVCYGYKTTVNNLKRASPQSCASHFFCKLFVIKHQIITKPLNVSLDLYAIDLNNQTGAEHGGSLTRENRQEKLESV